MCNMSIFAKFYGQLNMRSLRSWIFAAVLADCVDAVNKCTSAPVSCWIFTHHLNSTITVPYAQNFGKNLIIVSQHHRRRSVCMVGGTQQEFWGTEAPNGLQRQSPARRSGDEVPQKLELLCQH